jgi:hypothetical protein
MEEDDEEFDEDEDSDDMDDLDVPETELHGVELGYAS